MKKRLLMLALFVALFVAIFALTANASERTSISYTDASGVTHDVPIVKYDDDVATVAGVLGNNATQQGYFADNSSYVILKASDGSLTAYPTWYIIEPSGTNKDYIAISEVEYGYVNSKSGKTYSKGATLYVEFPEGMTHLRNNGVWGRGTHYENNVTEIVIPKSVTVAAANAFQNNTTLKRIYIKEGSAMTQIEDYAFEGCTSLEYFQFDTLTKLTLIDGFALDTKLAGDLDLSKNTELKTIGNNAFKDTLIGKITLPDSVESIGAKAFAGPNFYFASPYLPKNLTTVGNEFIYNTKNLNSLLIFPEGVTAINDEGFSGCYPADSSQTFTLVFLGKMTKVWIDGHSYLNWGSQTTVYFAQNSLSDVIGKVYSYTDKATGALGSVAVDQTSTGTLDLDIASQSPQSLSQVGDNFIRLVFCADNGKVETSHILTNDGRAITEDRGDFVMDGHTHYTAKIPTCTGDRCIVCDEMNYAPHIGDTYVTIAYPDGFDKNGYEMHLCDVCDAEYKSNVTRLPIFTASKENGYSTNADATGIAFGGYNVNITALKDYNDAHKDAPLNFGVIVVNPKYVGDTFMQNGLANATAGCLQVDLTDTEYSNLSIIINGFTGKSASISLVISLYAYTDETEVDFIQSEHTACAASKVTKGDATLYTVTVQSVANQPCTSLDALPEYKKDEE